MTSQKRQWIAGVIHAWRWPLGIIGYFVFHTAYRVLLGGSLGLDEAQTYVHAQEFRWGYGPQLPLYAWLQKIVFWFTGANLFGLALLKNAILCGTVLMVYRMLRSRQPKHVAGLAAAALILLPQISWESQRALTHSVLVSFSAVLTFATIWWIIRRPGWLGFATLGLVLAIGGLAKYNYALLPVAVFLAALSLPEARRNLWSWRLLVSASIAAVLLIQPLSWIRRNPDIAFGSARKFNAVDGIDLVSIGQGLGSLTMAVFSFVLLLLVVSGVLYWRHRQPASIRPGLQEQLIWRSIAVAIGLLLIAVMIAGITNVKDRWLQPVLIFTAPAAMLWLIPRLDPTGIRRLWQVFGLLGLLIIVGLPIHNFQGRAYRAAPFAALSEIILADLPSDVPSDLPNDVPGDVVVIGPNWVVGNLLYFAPGINAFRAGTAPQIGERAKTYVLIWKGNDPERGEAMFKREFAGDWEVQPDTFQTVSAPYRFAADQSFTLSLVLIGPIKD